MNTTLTQTTTDTGFLSNYQKFVKDSSRFPPEHGLTYSTILLNEEAGEVAGVVAKMLRDAQTTIASLQRRTQLIKELGDVLWCVASVCNVIDTTLEEVINVNKDKIASRIDRGVVSGSGDDR